MNGGDLLLAAAGLVLILEGLLPFVNPAAWRRVFEQALRLSDAQLRSVGLAAIAVGMLLMLLI